MAELGHTVVGVDVNVSKVERLAAGEVPFYEPGLEALLRKNLDRGRLRFTTSFEEATSAADVHFICVGTPQRRDNAAADLRYVDAALGALLPSLRPDSVIVGKSTVPVGTAARLARWLAADGPAGAELVWNPEFLREGFAVQDTLAPDRLVIGVAAAGGHGEQLVRRVYADLLASGVPVVVADLATAEIVKMAANTFLATKISFINLMADVCEAAGADVTVLAKALSFDARIGGRYLQAGVGFGGGCLPKDIRAFGARGAELGVDRLVSFLAEIDRVNLDRRRKTANVVTEMLGGTVGGRTVAVFGAAFKPNSDDVRDSPALDVAATLHRAGAQVRVYDPEAIENAQQVHPELSFSSSPFAAATEADLVLHVTEWAEFREMDPGALGLVVRDRRMVDARNVLDATCWRAAGWKFRSLGGA
jgi:UDPglucose 6-dehydrogenase